MSSPHVTDLIFFTLLLFSSPPPFLSAHILNIPPPWFSFQFWGEGPPKLDMDPLRAWVNPSSPNFCPPGFMFIFLHAKYDFASRRPATLPNNVNKYLILESLTFPSRIKQTRLQSSYMPYGRRPPRPAKLCQGIPWPANQDLPSGSARRK